MRKHARLFHKMARDAKNAETVKATGIEKY